MEKKYIGFGLAASTGLLLFYAIVSILLGGPKFALDNFIQLWGWMTAIITGFGVQIGLFFYMKDSMKNSPKGTAGVSTGISSGSMIACCAHHLADIAPFLGISVIGLFLAKYQTVFLLSAILANALGITYMILIIKKIEKSRIKVILYSLLILALLLVVFSFFMVKQESKIELKTLSNNQNSVTFDVTPVSLSEFDISIDTHSVSLDFDMMEISRLYDDLGNEYFPVSWDGSPPGGHHRSGTLAFSGIEKSTSIKLVITDNTTREFTWRLNG